MKMGVASRAAMGGGGGAGGAVGGGGANPGSQTPGTVSNAGLLEDDHVPLGQALGGADSMVQDATGGPGGMPGAAQGKRTPSHHQDHHSSSHHLVAGILVAHEILTPPWL